jgi:RNA polymerase sigma-70 factor (ECF subfamily)
MGEPAPAPDDYAEARQLAALLQDAIARLPERTRETFLLARQHGLSHAEIAEVMRISTSTVEKNLARATGRLRDVLAAWMEEPV